MTVVEDRTNTDGNGEAVGLPGSAAWVHEWQSFWVEIWVSTLGSPFRAQRATPSHRFLGCAFACPPKRSLVIFLQEALGTAPSRSSGS